MNRRVATLTGVALAFTFMAVLFLDAFAVAQSKEVAVYKDEKNGYFSFVPPKDWTIETYNDPRTKIAFRNPLEKQIFVRLIAREEPKFTFSELKREVESTALQWTKKGVPCKVQITECLGVPATMVSADLPEEGPMRLWRFLIGGLSFNIQYVAANKNAFDANLEKVDSH